MVDDEWLADTRTSYDTVATGYAEFVRDALTAAPFERAMLALLADLARTAGDGPVLDVGCGPGHLTAHLQTLGVDVEGLDLSPAMIDIARRDHPALQFEVGSMTTLDRADGSIGGILAWFSLIHVPDAEVPTVLAHFWRVLRPGCPLLLSFFVGEHSSLKTSGYGDHPMNVQIHRRPPARVAAWLRAAGFTVDAEVIHHHHQGGAPGAFLFASRATGALAQQGDAATPQVIEAPALD